MPKFQCLLFALKQSYICYYIVSMIVPSEKLHFSESVVKKISGHL